MTKWSGSPARVRVLFMAFVFPREERPKRRASVAVEGFLLGGQFGEGLGDLGEVEQRVIAEAVRASRLAAAERAERTPGAPPSASTSRPESSAITNSPSAYLL